MDNPGKTGKLIKAMKNSKIKKQWKKPQIRVVQVCCECTAYVDVA
jgi:hypothetical protein